MELEKPINDEQWRKLYSLAAQIKRLSPWQWMEECDLFGVQDRIAEEIGFVSVMGREGEHYAVTLYKGWGDLERYWLMQDVDESIVPEFMFETSQLMLSFEDRAQITAAEHRLIKSLGLSFRGRRSWPKFQAFRPGYYPWRLVESWEADHMITCLEQSLGVFMRVEDDPSLLRPETSESLLVRARDTEQSSRPWSDTYLDWPEPERMLTYYEVESSHLDDVCALPRSTQTVELDYFLARSPIGHRNERPMCAYVLLVTDAHSGYVLGSNVLDATGGLENVLGQIPSVTLRIFKESGNVPGEIRVSRPVLTQILSPLEDRLDTEVDLTESLPMTLQARDSLEAFMSSGGGPLKANS